MSGAGRPLGFAFKTSSYSGGGECVEVALAADPGVLVRDSKEPRSGTTLSFTTAEWSEFTDRVKNGEYDFGQ